MTASAQTATPRKGPVASDVQALLSAGAALEDIVIEQQRDVRRVYVRRSADDNATDLDAWKSRTENKRFAS